MTRIVEALTLVSEVEKQQILQAPKSPDSHRKLMKAVPAMSEIEKGGHASVSKLGEDVTVAAWNLERCLFVEQSATKLAALGADVVLLSEMDCGMARSAQRHTTRDMAEQLGMQYSYGVEFYEMGLGGDFEVEYLCKDDHNVIGWHGNAIMSKAPIDDLMLIRLDDHGHWFCTDKFADPSQPRIGGRMAIAAKIQGVCFISTHLESAANADHRCDQMAVLLSAVDEFANGAPVLIGGDLNTGNHLPPNYDWRDETLFKYCEKNGYEFSFNPEGFTTRESLITRSPSKKMKLDWFLARHLHIAQAGIEPSVDEHGSPLSDHDCIWVKCKI